MLLFIIRTAFAAQTFDLIQILHQYSVCVSDHHHHWAQLSNSCLLPLIQPKYVCVKKRRKVAKYASVWLHRTRYNATTTIVMCGNAISAHSPHNIIDFYFLSTKQKMITLVICVRINWLYTTCMCLPITSACPTSPLSNRVTIARPRSSIQQLYLPTTLPRL